MASGLGKGRNGTQLTIVDPLGNAPPVEAIKSTESNIFRTFDGNLLALQPRRSFYSGGLALDIDIGGMRESSAVADVASMRSLKR